MVESLVSSPLVRQRGVKRGVEVILLVDRTDRFSPLGGSAGHTWTLDDARNATSLPFTNDEFSLGDQAVADTPVFLLRPAKIRHHAVVASAFAIRGKLAEEQVLI